MRFTQGLSRHKIALLVCGAVLCLLVALFGLSVTGIFKIPFLESAVSAVVTPVQSFVTGVYNSARSGIEKRATIAELDQQLAELTERNRQLEATVAQMSELQKENDRLRGLLGVTTTSPEQKYIAAKVIAKESGGWFVTFTVDKGENDGVKKDDPVLNDAGLIGRVMDVKAGSCTVISIIDSRSAVAGMVERTRDNGICHGSLFVNDNDEMLRMNYLPTGSELNTGDLRPGRNLSQGIAHRHGALDLPRFRRGRPLRRAQHRRGLCAHRGCADPEHAGGRLRCAWWWIFCCSCPSLPGRARWRGIFRCAAWDWICWR